MMIRLSKRSYNLKTRTNKSMLSKKKSAKRARMKKVRRAKKAKKKKWPMTMPYCKL